MCKYDVIHKTGNSLRNISLRRLRWTEPRPGKKHKKFGEDQTCSSGDMIVDRHTHDGLSRRGRRTTTSSVRLAMGKQTDAQVHIIVPLAATGSFLAFRLATRADVRLSSKADMAFEQHCLQTHLSRGAVRNTDGARSHARRLILRLSL